MVFLNTNYVLRVFSDDETSGFYEPDVPWRGSNFDQRWSQARNSEELANSTAWPRPRSSSHASRSASGYKLPKSISSTTHTTYNSSMTMYPASESEAEVTDCFRETDIKFDIRRAIANYTIDDDSRYDDTRTLIDDDGIVDNNNNNTKNYASPAFQTLSSQLRKSQNQQPSVHPDISTPPSSPPVDKVVSNSSTGSAKTGPVLKPLVHRQMSSSSKTHSHTSSLASLPPSFPSSSSPFTSTSAATAGAATPLAHDLSLKHSLSNVPDDGVDGTLRTKGSLRKLITKGTSNSGGGFRNALSRTKREFTARASSSGSGNSQGTTDTGAVPNSARNHKSHRFRAFSQPFAFSSVSKEKHSAPTVNGTSGILPTAADARRTVSAGNSVSAPVKPLPKLDLDIMTDLSSNESGSSTFHDILDTYLKEDGGGSSDNSIASGSSPKNLPRVRRKPVTTTPQYNTSGSNLDISDTLVITKTRLADPSLSTLDPGASEEVKLQAKLNKLQEELTLCDHDIAKCKNALEHLEPFFEPAEFYKYSREERESLKNQEEETQQKLSALEKRKYEVGILYSKAWKRRRESGGSDFWVRSH